MKFAPTPLRLAVSGLLLGSLMFVSCKDDDKKDDPAPSGPTTYEFAEVNGNTPLSRALTGNLNSLTTDMKKGRDSSLTLTATQVQAYYTNGGQNSLQSKSESIFAGRASAWLRDLAAVTGKTFDPRNPTDGGVFYGYLFNKDGVELEQLVEKGLFGAGLFYRAVVDHLSKETLTAADFDNAFVYYGANAKFPNNNSDGFTAKYAARRDNGGHYRRIKEQLLAGRTAGAAGDQAAAKAAALVIRQEWEKALAATVINYLYASAEKFQTGTDADLAAALHSWGEGVGFIYGLRAIPAAQRTLSDANIATVLTHMKAEDNNRKPLDFKTPADIAHLQHAIDVLASAYGFSDPTIYKINDVTANNR